ncbi:MAG: HEAT repeat domain-containing protein [archaeon]|nr:HEAT repeat domain-containing protein [archaeon]
MTRGNSVSRIRPINRENVKTRQQKARFQALELAGRELPLTEQLRKAESINLQIKLLKKISRDKPREASAHLISLFNRASHSGVKHQVAIALRDIASPDAYKFVRRMAQQAESWTDRDVFIQALGEYGKKQDVKYLEGIRASSQLDLIKHSAYLSIKKITEKARK